METTTSATPKRKTSALQKVLSIVGITLCVVFALLLVCNLTIIIKGTLYPEKPPSVLGITPMVVLSGSMSGAAEDHIEAGDLIFVGKADIDALKAGDIIAYMEGKSATTHRIIEVLTDENGTRSFRTKGDANNTEDRNPVPADKIIGIYEFRIPKVGDLALFMQKPLGMAIFVGIPLLAFIIYDIIRRQRQSTKNNSKNAELQAELERLRALAGEAATAEVPADAPAEVPAEAAEETQAPAEETQSE